MQPQSEVEVRPVVEALQRLDPLLDVIWDPKAKMVKRGSYDATAGKRHDPEYEGRWKVIRRDTPGLTDRGYVVIVTVTQPTRFGARNVLIMENNGPYAPVGEWLVEYMQTYDVAQRHFAEVMDAIAKEHEKAESLAAEIDGGGAHQEALEKVYHQSAGSYWMGGAQGKAHPVTEAALFGKGKKTSTAGATSS